MKTKTSLLLVASLFISLAATAQNTVGIGTENSNNNAVLELVSPTNNQGFLVPRMTTAQRTAASFTNNLTNSENGLLVFDSDELKFYYWHDGAWEALRNGNDLTAGAGIAINAGVISNTGDADADPTNELQDLNLTGNILTITNNASATPIDLSGLSVTGSDNQQLSFDGTSILSLDNSTSVDLSALINDADADAANEIQDLTLNSNILSLSGDATTVDLSGYLDNTDAQDLSLVGTTLSLTGDATNVDLSGLLDNTDAQDLTLTANTLSLTGDPTSVDLSGYLDNTDAQDLTLTANTLSLSGDATSVDLSGYLDNTDNQTLSRTGNNLTVSGGNTVALEDQVAFRASVKTYTLAAGVTQLVFDALNYDLSGSFDVANSAFTAPYRGIYNFNGIITMLFDTGVKGDLYIRVNGGIRQIWTIDTSLNQYSVNFTVDLFLNAGDVVTLEANTSTGATSVLGYSDKGPSVKYTTWSGRMVVNLN